MNKELEIRDFIVGIEYDSPNENQGFFNIRRKVTLIELIDELLLYMNNGHNCPTFPPEANPTISYAWDLNNKDDGDCFHEIQTHLDRLNVTEIKNDQNLK